MKTLCKFMLVVLTLGLGLIVLKKAKCCCSGAGCKVAEQQEN